ncbi:SDR family NAD(P)-dependent oxidoreductase [Paenibacillus protaetiae]|uniref:SDR family oxidoreductase n=1 Tax=Paenibacillus protaetiae TaxID=2509456 RepID=A0A4P6F5R5_9BACL|nr:SDR family oxidoreductase [Paenibacillus protaetiae]QAY65738.1 SDR family oxidoreductase [Paenibacillus protaetiae]
MKVYKGKVVVITGAGGGIGRELAIAYAAQDAYVVPLDINGEGLRETEALIARQGGLAAGYVLDVKQPEAIVEVFNDVKEKFGRVDVLLNNAGIGKWKSPYELTVEEWDTVIHTNLRGTFLCAREAAALMRRNGGGAIVNIASTRALMSEPHSEAYAATKGGIVALTHALAVSFAPDRITVNAISPGWIETGDYSALKPSDHEQHPAGRVGTPADIARACLYLTNPDNDFVTGINLVVDGGMTRKMIYEE